jgi:Zn-dependent protease
MVAHEYAHGYAAFKQGDPTASELGRLTWNPVKHIDPFMTVLLPLMTFFGSGGSFIFGGAKPIPVMPRNYRNYKRGDIIVSLPVSPRILVLAVACTLAVIILGLAGRGIEATAESMAILQRMMTFGVFFNLLLAIFNLLPIPPLDGSHVMKYLLPPAWALRYQQFGRFGMILLILLIGTDCRAAPARRMVETGGASLQSVPRCDFSVYAPVGVQPGDVMAMLQDTSSPFVVELSQFSGPLDLLLGLIRDEKVDIYDIPISRIADQFLLRIGSLGLDQAADYLEMAARLLRIKAQMLLPRSQDDDGWEDPRAELVRRLLEYQQIREVADVLERMAEERRARFARAFLPQSTFEHPPAPLALFAGRVAHRRRSGPARQRGVGHA